VATYSTPNTGAAVCGCAPGTIGQRHDLSSAAALNPQQLLRKLLGCEVQTNKRRRRQQRNTGTEETNDLVHYPDGAMD
jgi:hypothetical protein